MDKEKVMDLLCERIMLHENDPEICRMWDEMTILLSQDLSDTINFLKECNEKQLYYLSEIFDDISYNLNSKEYIHTLYELNEKFPNAQMEQDIKSAEHFMEEIE